MPPAVGSPAPVGGSAAAAVLASKLVKVPPRLKTREQMLAALEAALGQGISTAQLARRAGIDTSALSRWRKTGQGLGEDTLARLRRVLRQLTPVEPKVLAEPASALVAQPTADAVPVPLRPMQPIAPATSSAKPTEAPAQRADVPRAPLAPANAPAKPLATLAKAHTDVVAMARTIARKHKSDFAPVYEIVRAFLRAGLGLSVDDIKARIVEADKAGLLELRPESGMGLLAKQDAALCIPGPRGSILSYARVL